MYKGGHKIELDPDPENDRQVIGKNMPVDTGWSRVAMACGADLSRACNKIAKNTKICGDVAHLILSSPLNFQGNPISQSFAIRLGSSWLRKLSQH